MMDGVIPKRQALSQAVKLVEMLRPRVEPIQLHVALGDQPAEWKACK